jgi:hypothetical protein
VDKLTFNFPLSHFAISNFGNSQTARNSEIFVNVALASADGRVFFWDAREGEEGGGAGVKEEGLGRRERRGKRMREEEGGEGRGKGRIRVVDGRKKEGSYWMVCFGSHSRKLWHMGSENLSFLNFQVCTGGSARRREIAGKGGGGTREGQGRDKGGTREGQGREETREVEFFP